MRDAGIATAAAADLVASPAAASTRKRSRTRPPHVVVLGGGIAGLTAAHELIERGFAVTVVERNGSAGLGGKARSIPVPGSGTGGRRDLPGEHGFRIFFGFYQHLTETMRRIPFAGNQNGVWDNLLKTSQGWIARDGGRAPIVFPYGEATLETLTPVT